MFVYQVSIASDWPLITGSYKTGTFLEVGSRRNGALIYALTQPFFACKTSAFMGGGLTMDRLD